MDKIENDENVRDAYSIPSFCKRFDISISLYHKLQKQQRGPRSPAVANKVE